MARSFVQTMADMERAERAGSQPTRPYDSVKMVHHLVRTTVDGSGNPKRYKIERPVATHIDIARAQGWDYYHPGGTIRESTGRVTGEHPEGWFLWGYKWAKDRPGITSVGVDDLPAGAVLLDDEDSE